MAAEDALSLRVATDADNEALLRLFGHVPMEGQLVLSTQRAPDFFALYRMQRGVSECFVADAPAGKGSGLVGMGSILVRDGWLDGRPTKVGYLGDLRSTFAARRLRGLAKFYGDTLESARARHGCDVFLTGVIASNAAALQALVRRSPKRPKQPHYALFRKFSLVSIQFTGRRQPRSVMGVTVRSAATDDVPRIAAFLAEDHRNRPFGYRFDEGELEHRLARWPGFSLERTYVGVDPGGAVVGVTSAWDPTPVKRYRVEAYRGALAWQKRAFNAAAAVMRWRPLPRPGEDFRTLYLCNTSIRRDDPEILRALIDRVYADAHPLGFHLLSAPVYENDPWAPAFDGFIKRALDFHLYAVTSADAPRTEFPAGRPGFEPALA